jgi:Bacterial Ig-like domain (group 1)
MSDLSSYRMRAIAVLAMAAVVPAISACGDHKLGPATPASVSIVSGDTQKILVGDRASQPLLVEIKNSDGSPLANIPVIWAVISGGGSLQPVTDTTDVNGQARATYLSPAIAGTAKVTAMAANQIGTFTLTVAADTVGTISAFAGDGSAALVGFQLTLIAKATDRFGNAISGLGVSWSASSGILQLPNNATDSTGKATNVITVGPDTGKVAISATSRFNTITFTVSALPTK